MNSIEEKIGSKDLSREELSENLKIASNLSFSRIEFQNAATQNESKIIRSIYNDSDEEEYFTNKLEESLSTDSAISYFKTQCLMSNFSWLKSELSDIGKISYTSELYLLTLKKLGYLFFFLSGLSAYPMYACYLGKTLRAADLRFGWEKTSVSNLNEVTDSKSFEENVSSLYVFLVIDMICCAIYLIFLLYLQHSNNKLLNKRIKENISIEDYSVEVTDILPIEIKKKTLNSNEDEKCSERISLNHEESKKKEEEEDNQAFQINKDIEHLNNFIGEFCGGKGNIKKVHLITDSKISNLKDSLRRLERKIKSCGEKIEESVIMKSKQFLQEKLNQLNKHQKSLIASLENANSKKSNVIRYIIYLKTFEARQELVKTFFYTTNGLLRIFCARPNLKYTHRNQNHASTIKIVAGDHPLSINWHHSVFSKNLVINISVTFIIVILLIGTSYEMIYYLKKYTETFASRTDCSDIEWKYSLERAKQEYTTENQKYCYCRLQFFQSVFFDSDMRSYCISLYNDILISGLFRFLVGFGVWVISFTVQRAVIVLLPLLMKHYSRNKENMHILLGLFPLTVINMGVVTVTINIKHELFSREWYSTTGSSIMCTLILGIATSHMSVCMSYTWKLISRKICYSKIRFQSKLNKKYFSILAIGQRNALILSIVCLCFMFSSGMPFMNFICLCNLLSFYFIDKLVLLKFYQTPKFENKLINERFIILLHWPLGLHILLSYYSYTQKNVFPTQFIDVEGNVERFDSSPVGICCALMGFLTFLSFVSMYFEVNLLSMCLKCLRSEVENPVADLDSFLTETSYAIVKKTTHDNLKNCFKKKKLKEKPLNVTPVIEEVDSEEKYTGTYYNPGSSSKDVVDQNNGACQTLAKNGMNP